MNRSQAAPEIRLVSGRHLKEFSEFLQSRVDHFIVEGDRVRLKNMPEPVVGIELDDEGKPLSGVKAKTDGGQSLSLPTIQSSKLVSRMCAESRLLPFELGLLINNFCSCYGAL